MATRAPAPEELLCVDELERKLTDLSELVELKKEEMRSNFQQLHTLLLVRETFLLKEMDDIVKLARQEVSEKKGILIELYAAREGLERDLTKNKLKKVLEKNLHVLEAEIGEELAGDVNVGWMELEWKREELEQSVVEVCKVVRLKERPVTRVDHPKEIKQFHPVWSHDGTDSGYFDRPRQIAIEDSTHNIFVVDHFGGHVKVFNEEGNYLYDIAASSYPIGIALTDQFIFVSTSNSLLKIDKLSRECIDSVKPSSEIFGIETSTDSDVYLCGHVSHAIVVFSKDLKFLKRIKLNSSQFGPYTRTYSM